MRDVMELFASVGEVQDLRFDADAQVLVLSYPVVVGIETKLARLNLSHAAVLRLQTWFRENEATIQGQKPSAESLN